MHSYPPQNLNPAHSFLVSCMYHGHMQTKLAIYTCTIVLFFKQLLQAVKTSVQKLRDEGKSCFAKQDYDQALKKYEEASKICEEHQFEEELAIFSSNMAAVYLKLNNFEAALDYSNKCLELNPKYFKVCRILVCRVFTEPHASACISCTSHLIHIYEYLGVTL